MIRAWNRLHLLQLLFIAVLIALSIAFLSAPPGGRVRSALFHLGIGRQSDEKLVLQAVRSYNAATQGIYATSGLAVEELAVIPATMLEKRRIYKDVNLLRLSGKMVVFDKDAEQIEKVAFIGCDQAVVTSSEVWVLVLQDFVTRRKLTSLKASQISCRYYLLRRNDAWLVERVEVFPKDEALPPLNIRPVL